SRVVAGADEGAAPVVHAHAVLAAAAGYLERFGARVKEEALAAYRNRPGILLAGVADRASAGAGLDMDAVVEAPAKRVEQGLAANIIAGKAGKDDPADIGLAIAVGVLG